jgi:hypothetical protein
MEVPETLQQLDLEAFAGRPVEEVRDAVEAAGGALRVVAPDGAMTADYRPSRVTVVAEDGIVLRSLGIG